MKLAATPVHDFLYETAQKFGDRPAFDFFGKKWTWSAMRDLVDRAAAGLQKQDVGKGVKVGLLLPNSPYFLIAYYAILRTGATVVNLNPLYAVRELSLLIEDSEADMLVTIDLNAVYDKVKQLSGTRLKKIIVCSFTDVLPVRHLAVPPVQGRPASIHRARREHRPFQ